MKLVVNMIMGRYSSLLGRNSLSLSWNLDYLSMICSMMASFSEGLLLSEKVGLDPSVLVEVRLSKFKHVVIEGVLC